MKKLHVKAFTLIEILVVISIIGILAALMLANFSGARDRAEDARTKSNLKEAMTQLRLSYNDNNAYPGTATPVNCDNTATLGTALGQLQARLPTGTNCRYVRNSVDTFTMCANLVNTNDREREYINAAGGGTDRCPNEPTGQAAGQKFCVCAQ